MFETLEDRRLFSTYGPVDTAGVYVDPANSGPKPTKFPGMVVANPGTGVLDPGTGTSNPNISPTGKSKVVGDTLYVMGTQNADSIQVGQYFDYFQIYRSGVWVETALVPGVTKIVIAGFGGSDALTVHPLMLQRVFTYGGDGNDYIQGGGKDDFLDGGNGDDTIKASDGNDVIHGTAGNDQIWGDNGNDELRGWAGDDMLDGGAGNDTLYGADNNDTLFAGLGTDTLYGGNGDDTLVSVFGGVDKVNGDQGWDIFMADKSDTLTDMDNLASTRKSIFRIDKFANGTKGYNTATATELGKVAITDPTLTSTAKKYTDFSYLPLFNPGGPKMGDVQQNQLNDCWLATTAGSVAQSTPWVIKRTVIPLGDSTFAVAVGGKVYRVDADLPVNQDGSVIYGSTTGRHGSSLWFPLLEKGMAYHMRTGGTYSYSDVESDTPGTAYVALGVSYDKSTLVPFGTDESLMWDKIRIGTGKAMTITTEPSVAGVDGLLRPSHAYSVIRTFRQGNGTKMVVLRNPTDMNGNNKDSDGFVTISASKLYSSCLLLYIAK